MTPEAQRIAIAEACGWTDIAYRMTPSGEFRQLWAKNKKGKYFHLPDYLNDLNAMHEAEKTLRRSPRAMQTGGFGRYIMDLISVAPESVTATAAQRAEAFLRAIGKWDDSK